MIEGARVFCVFTREWLDGDVAVADGRIAGHRRLRRRRAASTRAARYLVPGFIDAHMHVESSKLTPAEFARAVLPHGTTAVVCDPHEVANVLGSDGVHWMLDASEGLPLTVFVMAPSCVPASALRVAAARADAGRHGGDPAPPAGARRGRDDELPRRHRRRSGGAARSSRSAAPRTPTATRPGVVGRALDAYAAAGIRSDHEATTLEEALEKRRRGMWVLIREASNARNLRDAAAAGGASTGRSTARSAPTTASRTCCCREGHINQMCRIAVEEGIAAEDALLMATLHAARAHGLDGHGAIAPGLPRRPRAARRPRALRARRSCSRAAAVAARDGRAEPFDAPADPRPRAAAPCAARRSSAADLALDAAGAARVRVIEIVPEQLITIAREVEPTRARRRASSPTRRATSPRSP